MKENKQTKKMSLKKVLPIMSGAGFLGLSAILIATSTGLSTQTTANNLNQRYTFDNQTFNSTQDLLEYGQANYYKGKQIVDNRFRWSIDDKGEKVYFNDPSLLREHLSKRINCYTGLSSSKFSQDISGIGEISGNDLAKLYFNQSEDQLKTEIYRGKNNSIHKSEEAAKDSYLSIHDAYYFNNIYFKNIEDLRLYLGEEYYVPGGDGYDTANASQNIGIIGPDGIISSGMNVVDLFGATPDSLQSKKDFMDNVSNQAKKYIEFKDSQNKYFYANQEDLNNPYSKLLDAFNNPSYTKVYSNQGKSSVVIDLNKEDPNTLFGPYYLQTAGDLSAMKDHDHWIPTAKDDPFIFQEKNSTLISNLMNLILIEETDFDNELPFNIKYLNETHLKPFYKLLKSKHPRVYQNWLDTNNEMKKGQKYNTFYNLPISYAFLLENLMEDRAGQNIINEVQKIFITITEYMDYVIGILFPRDLLKSTNPANPDDFLSLKEIFDFDNNDLDWNVDIQYFITKISDNFKQFIAVLNIFSQATLNAMYSGGNLPYRNDFIENILSKNPGVFKIENSKLYEGIWDIFSSSDMKTIKDAIVSKNPKSVDNDFIDDIVVALSTTNSLFSNAAEFLFMENIKDVSEMRDEHNLLVDFRMNDDLTTIGRKILEAKDSISWNNFMLIKFINKADRKQLNQIDNFNGNQDNLYIQLQNIITNKNLISLEEYVLNFVIEPKTVNNFAVISNLTGASVKFADSYLKANKWLNKNITPILTKQIKNLEKIFKDNSMSNAQDAKNLFSLIKFNKSIKLFSKGVPYVQEALLVLDLVTGAFVPKTKYSSYTFDDKKGAKFIWNGGQQTTMFFGLLETSSTTIKDMLLLEPQKIVNSRPNDGLYFNGKIYSETDIATLKIDQLKSILNGDENFTHDNIKVVYSFNNISTIESNLPTINRNKWVFDKFGDINDLSIQPADQPYNSLSQHVYNQIYYTKDGMNPMYHAKKFIFANGSVANHPDDNITMLINQVVDNIQSVKIALKPNLKNNKPKAIDGSNEEDGSISEYTLPSTSWSAQGINVNRTNNQYIVFDPNQKLDSEKVITDGEAQDNVRKLFHSSFDIDSKTIIKNEINNNNMFSELSSYIHSNYIYEATLSNNLKKYFFNESDAMNWLLVQENFTLYSYNTENHIYEYEGQIFNSKDEFINFILENATLEDK